MQQYLAKFSYYSIKTKVINKVASVVFSDFTKNNREENKKQLQRLLDVYPSRVCITLV